MSMSTMIPGNMTTEYMPETMTTMTMTTTVPDIMSTFDYTNITSSTVPSCEKSDIPFFWGFVTAAIAIAFYGTNFAPVKKFDTGDGMFFQWILCIAIWCCGLVVQAIRGSPQFYPLAMLGGALWETGNICVVPIIKTIGLGLGLCIWGMTNLLSGWATGRFGLFGLKSDPPDNPVLNDIGVILAVSSAVIFAMVKNEVSTSGIDSTMTVNVSENSPLLQNNTHQNHRPAYTTTHSENHDVIVFEPERTRGNSINQIGESSDGSDTTFIDRLNPGAKRVIGIVLSAVSGVFYGQMFTPAIYIQDNYDGASTNALDYVFATFTGILATSTIYFLMYAAFTRNNPKVYPRAILPGFVSGLMWGVATSSWFVANKVLSEAVAFPIVTTGPGVVASILGVLVFKEIQGRRNILILLLGMTVTITGSILAGLSKKASKC